MDDPIFKTWVIEDKLWRVEKVEKLKSIGLKKGAVVQYFNFEDKKMKKYEIKDSVHIRMVHQSSMVNEKDAPNFRTFYVLLSDDITQGKDEYADADSDKTTGIAYLGERFTLNPVQDVTPSPAQEIDLKDTEFKTIVSLFDEKLVNSGLSDHKIGKASYTSYKNNRIYNLLFISDNHKPYSEDDSRDHDDSGSVLRTSTDKIWIISSPEKFHDYGSGGISTWNFVEEAGAGFLEQEGGMHSCMVVHLLIGDEMERHQIQCDSGGC